MSEAHVVRPGDTLSSIARRHGCSLESLRNANKGLDPLHLRVGASVTIPASREAASVKRPADNKLDPAKSKPRTSTQGTSPSTIRHLQAVFEDGMGNALLQGFSLWQGLNARVTAWLREKESAELVHDSVTTKSAKPKAGKSHLPKGGAAQSEVAKTRNAARKHRDEVLKKLRDRLYETPHVVQTAGVKLTRNERKMLVAAVGLCEVNNDVFGAENRDTEFKGRKFGQRGIETGYSRIVHVGLSYGYIQFTQDSGNLGRLLQKMYAKVLRTEFETFFPNATQLLQLTTDGLPGEEYNRFGTSGLVYWNDKRKLSAKARADLIERTTKDENKDDKPDDPLKPNEEIRGARVQKIAYKEGFPAIDLWEDYASQPKGANYKGWASAFRAAGDEPKFQDAQLELAVEDFANVVLKHCQAWNIRSATGLAFVLACGVRGGANSKLVTLFSRVAEAKFKLKDRFATPQQELETIKAIADAKADKKHMCEVEGVIFHEDEKRRAQVLLKDEFDFLTEDLYDPATYGVDCDK